MVKAVNDLSYQVREGETLGIVGESGSGKSVSSMAIMNLLPKPPAMIGQHSSVQFMGQELLKLSDREMRKFQGSDIAMIFQDPMTCLNPYRRVDHQLIEGLVFHKKVSRKEAIKKAERMLEYVNIPDAGKVLLRYPHELSGGMRQRVMIAMALIGDPKLIFADEPTTALDVTVQAQIMDLFKDIKQQFKAGIVMISHDLGLISTNCDHILVMYGGQMMEYGTPEDIFTSPKHPYTIALKESIPGLIASEDEPKYLPAIEGNPPNLLKLKPGCPFNDRCAFSQQDCQAANIPLQSLGAVHQVRCTKENLGAL
jgi:oligopeptide transport system ATP-binding protein